MAKTPLQEHEVAELEITQAIADATAAEDAIFPHRETVRALLLELKEAQRRAGEVRKRLLGIRIGEAPLRAARREARSRLKAAQSRLSAARRALRPPQAPAREIGKSRSVLSCLITPDFAAALRSRSAERGWTDADLARAVGFQPDTVRKYLNAQRPCPAWVVQELMRALDIAPGTLLSPAPPAAPEPVKRATGKLHGNARLTDQQIVELRAAYAGGGVTMSELGQRFGVTTSYVSRIIRRQYRAADLPSRP